MHFYTSNQVWGLRGLHGALCSTCKDTEAAGSEGGTEHWGPPPPRLNPPQGVRMWLGSARGSALRRMAGHVYRWRFLLRASGLSGGAFFVKLRFDNPLHFVYWQCVCRVGGMKGTASKWEGGAMIWNSGIRAPMCRACLPMQHWVCGGGNPTHFYSSSDSIHPQN